MFDCWKLVPAFSLTLQVGCGAGHLAKLLAADDSLKNAVEYVAIDSSEHAISAATSGPLPLGLDGLSWVTSYSLKFILADFVQFEDPEKFDILLFTRSLHHIFPLAKVP